MTVVKDNEPLQGSATMMKVWQAPGLQRQFQSRLPSKVHRLARKVSTYVNTPELLRKGTDRSKGSRRGSGQTWASAWEVVTDGVKVCAHVLK
jgi:hypothetical protein